MTGWSLILGLVALALLVNLPKLLGWAREAAAEGGYHGADGDDRPGDLWYLIVWVVSLGYGVWAVRYMWQSIPKGELGWGGLIYLMLAIPVFAMGMGAAGGVMIFLIRHLGSRGRLAGLLGGIALLILGLGIPMAQQASQAGRDRLGKERADFESRLAMSLASMDQIDHAPPGVVPDILAVAQDAHSVDVRNVGGDTLLVSVLRVLPRGRQWDRCWLGVQVRNCTPEAESCSYQLAKDGSRQVSPGYVKNHRPVLKPGMINFFRNECEPRFKDAPLEFRLTDQATGEKVFMSDSAFVPDLPRLPD